MPSLFIQQTKTIIKKNFLYLVRKKSEFFKELAVPLISALVIYAGKPQQVEDSQAMQKTLDLMSNMTKLMLPLYLPTAITGFAKKHLISFVQEKHERFKETQKIMGLTQQAYISGWLITSYIKMISIAVITIFSLYVSGYAGDGFVMLSLNFCVYLIASVHQTFAISTFFSTPKLAGEIGTFILTLTPLLYYYITYGTHVSDTSYMLLCLLPQTAISFAVLGGGGASTGDSGDDIISNTYSQNVATYMLIFDVFFYLFLYFYLDEVIPNEYGINKSPFFIFSKKYWKDILYKGNRSKQALKFKENYNSFSLHGDGEDHKSSNKNSEGDFLIEMRKGAFNEPNQSYMASLRTECNPQNGESSNDLVANSNHTTINITSGLQKVEDKSSAKYHQKLKQNEELFSPIQIIDLKKQYGQMFAVDGLSLNLYESQILCLLGHNGAGKTTTISLLTGLIEKTSGSIKIFGEDLEADLDLARQEIGLCTQKDVLYDDMTVTEHLEFIANIKGLEGVKVKNEVEDIIKQVGLDNERNKFANNLSGGNKRKLSLGMALTGGSKIIFLDEPTSGMDPVSRQQIWAILEKVRDKRAIVLTTHHLDEAEKLADRIAIMSKGQLLAVGTSEFIKKKFGVGYHLTLSCKSHEHVPILEKDEQVLTEYILSNISGSIQNKQSAKDSLKFILPFSSIGSYSSVLEQIENYKYLNINLQINSLEDAFVKIGLDDEQETSLENNNSNKKANVSTIQYDDEDEESKQNLNEMSSLQNNKSKYLFDQQQESLEASINPKYSFFNQFYAMFLRQHYMTTRNWSAILMILLPIAFNLLGVYVAKHFLDNIEELLKLGDDKDLKKQMNSEIFPIKMYFLQIFIVQAYSMNSSIYINTPVLEREFQLKYALNVMGCRPLPYWLGTLTYDYLIYFVTFMIFYYSVHTIRVEFLTPYLGPLFYIMVCFGFALIIFCYVCGFLFKNSNSAFKSFPIITFFVSYSIPWIVLQVTRQSYPTLNAFFQYFFLLTSPFLALEKAFENVDTNHRGSILSTSDIRGNQVLNTWQDYCRIMIVQAILFLIITMIIERFQYSIASKGSSRVHQPPIQGNIDEGVQREIERVKTHKDPIKVEQIQKIYPNGFHAVKGTTFGVEKGQIFGLLGPNGAGKSTTFNIITANIAKTAGSVKLNDKEISENSASFFTDIGVCPQQDCLWEYLLPVEHLNLFGRVKGLSGQNLQKMVDYYLKAIHLESFKVKSVNLSGGNKRKLCVANSLIASPSLQFFDEPSTGLDPIAKRYLWKCLQDNLKNKNSAIVLTTHSLQEAEDLCHKVGIQVNGQFVCLDTLQNLKNQKGDGYKIYIKLMNQSETSTEEIHSIIRNAYPNLRISNENTDYISYLVPYQGFKFSQAFSLLYDTLKLQKKIEDFSITQSSLEDIFIEQSKKQVQPRNDLQSNTEIISI